MRKKILFVLCSVFFITTICFGINMASYGSEEIVVKTNLEEVYKYNQTIDIQKGDVTLGNETLKVRPDVIYPSNLSYNVSQIVLNETGRYTLLYIQIYFRLQSEHCFPVTARV